MGRKTIVIGDIHGRLDIVKSALSLRHSYDIVFVGDILDSYDRRVDDQILSLLLILNACNPKDKRVQCTLGNHDLQYLDMNMRCSGYNLETQETVGILYDSMVTVMKPFIWVGDYLISHAGVSNSLLESKGLTLKEYLEDSDFKQIGYSRGGYDPCGGLYWCDWWDEFEPVPGTKQVVGHSNYRPAKADRGIVTKRSSDNHISYNIDCLDRIDEVLLINPDNTAIVKTLSSIEMEEGLL